MSEATNQSAPSSVGKFDWRKEIVRVVNLHRQEAQLAKRYRILKNRRNWNLYYGKMDWSHKAEGQSTEFIPKLSIAADNLAGFVKRALVQYGDFFQVKAPARSPLTAEQIRKLIRYYLEQVRVSRNKYQHVGVVMSNAIKQALLESLIVLKVHGIYNQEREYRVEPGHALIGIEPELKVEVQDYWRLQWDLVPTNDFFPDPTGRNLYRIHRVERDYADVYALADGPNAIYKKSAVKKLQNFVRNDMDRKLPQQRNQERDTPPDIRKRVVIDEYWGTILDKDGRVAEENCVCAVGNEVELIREPEDFPFWHGEDPFIVAPLIQTPDSVWGKAVFDDAASLNVALIELFNLILDGGIGAVWGVRQLREDWLADPRQASGGIPQGTTLLVSADAPEGAKVLETVTTGSVPPEAMAAYTLTERVFQEAALTSDMRAGQLPPRQVKATEIVSVEQNQSVTLDSISSDLEHEVMEGAIRKSWLLILQHMDDLPSREIVEAVGPEVAFTLAKMKPADRFAQFAVGTQFKVTGLSATLAKAKDFQKIMALAQAIGTNPMLMQAFMKKMSPDKFLDSLFKALNLNPEDLGITDSEKATVGARLQEMTQLAGAMNPGQGGGSLPGGGGGDAQSSMRSDINQNAEPGTV